MESGCIDPYFLDLGTSWKLVVSFRPLLLYPRGTSPWYPLDRRLGEPQSPSGRHGEEKILDATGTRTPTPRSSSPYAVAIPTALPRLTVTGIVLPFYIPKIKIISKFVTNSVWMQRPTTLGQSVKTFLNNLDWYLHVHFLATSSPLGVPKLSIRSRSPAQTTAMFGPRTHALAHLFCEHDVTHMHVAVCVSGSLAFTKAMKHFIGAISCI
jgi:hypothetical protein